MKHGKPVGAWLEVVRLLAAERSHKLSPDTEAVSDHESCPQFNQSGIRVQWTTAGTSRKLARSNATE